MTIKYKEQMKAVVFGGLFLIVMVMMASFCLASIEQLGVFQQNDCIQIPQICSTCSYNNISSIINPDGTYALNGEYGMTKNGLNYNYSFCDTDQLGTYTIGGHGDLNYVDDTFTFSFDVTPSGSDGNVGFFILIIGVIYAIAFIGFFGKNEWVTILGGMAMLGLGIYMINSGIIIFRDSITDIFSWTTIGLGAFFVLYTGISVIQDTYN